MVRQCELILYWYSDLDNDSIRKRDNYQEILLESYHWDTRVRGTMDIFVRSSFMLYLCWLSCGLVSIFAPLIKSIMLGLIKSSINQSAFHPKSLTSSLPQTHFRLTFVKVTFGTMTVFNALGASLGDFFLSPPGWYWYLKFWPALSPFELPTCHGMLPSAILTLASEEAEVGLRPGSDSWK